MTKVHYIIIILGLPLFFWDISYGLGWLLGWLFTGLLSHYRVRILEKIIDFDHFSTMTYVGYLVGVIFWIAAPLLLAFWLPHIINPLAVFAALFIDRALNFILNSQRKKGN